MDQTNWLRHQRQQYLVELGSQLELGKISAAEFTTLCLLPELVRTNSGGFQRKILSTETDLTPLTDFLRRYSWKGHTDRIRRSLLRWHQGCYPLELWNQIPTPLELLKVQACGKRVITVFTSAELWEQTHFGKSAWEFVVHDLVHADHFFENPVWRDGQVQFYQFILEKWDHPLIESLKLHCLEQFDYLISDMNSHPQHMYQTLAALSLQAWKKQRALDLKSRLSTELEAEFQRELSCLLETRFSYLSEACFIK
jgi:hypothetical protein